MKPSLLAAALCLAALPALPAVVDPTLLNLAMPNAQALTGVLVYQVQSSPFGQYVLSQIQIDSELARIMTATGFDPRKDLYEIVAASASNGTGLVIGGGTFSPQISAVAVTAGAVSSTYRGVDILTAPARHPIPNGTASQSASFAFPNSALVVLGDTTSVKGAIDRYLAGATFSGPLAQQAMGVSAGNDIWFVTSQSPANFFAGKAPNQGLGNLANAFQAIQQTSGGVKFSSSGATVALTLTADSAQDAQSLVDVGKFLVSMVDSNRNQNPAAGKAATLADAATFSASGPVATVNLTLSEQQLEQLLMPPSGAAQSKRRAAAR